MASINTPVASVLVTLTVLGALFYLGIIIVGAPSYECPFQTLVSTGLHRIWTTTKSHMIPTLYPVVVVGKPLLWLPVLTTLCHLWGAIQCQILHIVHWLPSIAYWLHSHNLSLPTT